MNLGISKKTMKKWRNRLLFIAAVALVVFIYFVYINSFSYYDFSHLTRHAPRGERVAFSPLGPSEVQGMELAAVSQNLELYIDLYTTSIAVRDLRNGYIWYSSPPGLAADTIANNYEKGAMQSSFGLVYYDIYNRQHYRWSYADSARHGQAVVFAIPNGVRVEYTIGETLQGAERLPSLIEMERFETRVAAEIRQLIADGVLPQEEMEFIDRMFVESRSTPGFMLMLGAVANSAIHTNRMLNIFDLIGYTVEELIYDMEAGNMAREENELEIIEINVNLDVFYAVMEFVLEDDCLNVYVPMDEIVSDNPANMVNRLDIMKYFGAGHMSEDGWIFVPSGSGALIDFNNGKNRDGAFYSPVYGADLLTTRMRPQIEQPVRLPVLGIKREGAAVFTHIESGSGMAAVNADISGRLNSYNYSWFSYNLRSTDTFEMVSVPGDENPMMTVVQPLIYTGDIIHRYHFIAEDAPTIGHMAGAYQGYLVGQGVLSPLADDGARSFYLDILGAIDIRKRIVGIPYTGTEVMTTISEAEAMVDLLNSHGVGTIQMQLHGWFNRGVNHDAAKRVNILRNVGSSQELRSLGTRLNENGGALFPAVNIAVTNYDSKNINRTFEIARNPLGLIGVMSSGMRDTLSIGSSHHDNDFFQFVHPAVMPFHIDRFIPAYINGVGLGGLALTDLGGFLTESMYRRGAVDREHSRLIAMEQLMRINKEIPNLLVFGGNDYSFGAASHLVDVPTEADRYYIIDHEVPFYQMVVHGYIEYAGSPINTRENHDYNHILLNMLTTGASPRYTWTAKPTREAQNSPYERFYSTQYLNWVDEAATLYGIYNEVYGRLKGERMVDFEILASEPSAFNKSQVTATVFSDGTKIYVNNTHSPFHDGDIYIDARGYYVMEDTP